MEETTIDECIQHQVKNVVASQHTLSNQAVQVLVVWTLDTQISSADIVDGFIVNHEAAVRVLKGCVGGQNGVVWLND